MQKLSSNDPSSKSKSAIFELEQLLIHYQVQLMESVIKAAEKMVLIENWEKISGVKVKVEKHFAEKVNFRC